MLAVAIVRRLMSLMLVVAACGGGLVHAETLRFATEPFPPFNYEQNGQAAGPMVDIVRAACERLRATCRIEVMPWRRALLLGEQGKVDGVFSLVRLPEREAAFHLGPPVADVAYAVFVRDNNALRYGRPADLAGYTVAAYGPSGTFRVLETLQAAEAGLQPVQEIDNSTALRKLAAGRYGERGAIVINRDIANHLIREENLANVRHAGDIRHMSYHVGMSRRVHGEATARRFHQALEALIREGKVRTILKQYGLRPPLEP